MSGGYQPIRKLQAGDLIDTFDCGQPPLNHYLQRFALVNQQSGSARTYVLCIDNKVVGYYSLAVGSVEHSQAPDRVSKGLARHPVPVMLLARLAVDLAHQRQGLGRALLKDALLRTLAAADIAGIRALLVHAKDASARAWYEGWNFEKSPTDPFHLFILLKDIKASLDGRSG